MWVPLLLVIPVSIAQTSVSPSASRASMQVQMNHSCADSGALHHHFQITGVSVRVPWHDEWPAIRLITLLSTQVRAMAAAGLRIQVAECYESLCLHLDAGSDCRGVL